MTALSSDFGHWVPMQQVDAPNVQAAHASIGMSGVEVWVNDVYEAFMHVYAPGQAHLSIKRRDRRPIRNWRHFQQIKNEVCGPETEAVELYPAESRLADNANQYHLWVMLEPPGDGELGELTGEDMKVTDVLVIPRDPNALGKLGVGWGEGFVTTDEQAERVTNDDTGAKQEPWQPGLTTGRMPQTPYQTPEVEEQTRRAVEAMRDAD